jgi:hypothetical protein
MKIVTPGSDLQIVSVGAYLTFNGSNVFTVLAGVMSDNSGQPDKVIAAGQSIIFGANSARWVDIGVGYVAAASTAIHLVVVAYASAGNIGIAYDGSGVDYTKATGQYIDEPNADSNADARKYSIRASTIAI